MQVCAPEDGSFEKVAAAPRDPDGKLLRVHVQHPPTGHLQHMCQVLLSGEQILLSRRRALGLLMQVEHAADQKYLVMWLRPDISRCGQLQIRDQAQEDLGHHCSGGWRQCSML